MFSLHAPRPALAALLALTATASTPAPAAAAEMFPQGSSDTWTLSNGYRTMTLTRSWLYGLVNLGCGAPDFAQTQTGYTASTYAGTFRGATVYSVIFHDMDEVSASLDAAGIFDDLYKTDGGGIYSTDGGGIYSTDGGGIYSWDSEDWYPLTDYLPGTSYGVTELWEEAATYDDIRATTCSAAGVTDLVLQPGFGPVILKATDGSVYKLKSAKVNGIKYGN